MILSWLLFGFLSNANGKCIQIFWHGKSKCPQTLGITVDILTTINFFIFIKKPMKGRLNSLRDT